MTLILNEETAARLQVAARERGTDPDRLLDQIVRDALERLPVTNAPNDTPEAAQPFKRIAGLTPGAFVNISDDFDAELPDSFWLGEEE